MWTLIAISWKQTLLCCQHHRFRPAELGQQQRPECQEWHVPGDNQHSFKLLCQTHGHGLSTTRCQNAVLWHAQLLAGRSEAFYTLFVLKHFSWCHCSDSSESIPKGHASWGPRLSGSLLQYGLYFDGCNRPWWWSPGQTCRCLQHSLNSRSHVIA